MSRVCGWMGVVRSLVVIEQGEAGRLGDLLAIALGPGVVNAVLDALLQLGLCRSRAIFGRQSRLKKFFDSSS